MDYKEKVKMFNDVFAPKPAEKILFLYDTPHENIKDLETWRERREMVQDWYKTFKILGEEKDFYVDIMEFEATGVHNSPLPKKILDSIKKSNLVIAMTEFSASSSLVPISWAKGSKTRCASMPGVEKRMEETVLKADYKKVQTYAKALDKFLTNAKSAEIVFSMGDKLIIDLRNRNTLLEAGDCTKAGQFINFPSGEVCKAPYEATPDEINKYGISKTEGVWPVDYDRELIKYVIKNNKIVDIIGNGKKAVEMKKFFNVDDTRGNIAELGIGCNPKAVVSGNVLEDEKVGLHIAYGHSTHLGGKVKSDIHIDIVHAKGCPVEGTTLTLINSNGSKIDLIKDSMLRYELLK